MILKFGGILLVLVATYLLLQGILESLKKDAWKGFYYPQGDTSHPLYSNDFRTREECADWAEGLLNSRPQDEGIPRSNLYECGKNCKVTDTYKKLSKNPNYRFKGYPTYECEETY